MLSWVIVPNWSAWNSRLLQAYLKPHSATKKGFHDGLSTSLLSLEKASLRIKSSKDVMTGPPPKHSSRGVVWCLQVFRVSVYGYVHVPCHQPGSMFGYDIFIYLPAACSPGIQKLRMRDHCHHSIWGLCNDMNMEYHGIWTVIYWYINAFWRICPPFKFRQLFWFSFFSQNFSTT